MKENYKKLHPFLRIVVLVGVLAGIVVCSREKKIVLEFGMFTDSNWDVANADSYAIVDKVIAQFEREHKGVEVHFTSGIRKEDYSEWFAAKTLAGKAPDVAMILSEDFDRLVSLDVLMKLDNVMAEDKDFDSGKYYDTALRIGEYKGGQYALPYEVVPKFMCVNRTLLQRESVDIPGYDWSWDEFYDLCEKITKDKNKDGVIDQFGVYNYTWEDAAYANGADLFNADGTASYLADEKVIESVKFINRLDALNNGQSVRQDDFDGGAVAFMPLSYAEYRTYKRYPYRLNKYSNFKWDCITLPAGPDGDNASKLDGLLMGISADTKEKELAFELLKLFTYDEKVQMDIYRYSQGASALKGVTNSKEAQQIIQEDMESDEKFIDRLLLSRVVEQGVVLPKFHGYEGVMMVVYSRISQIVLEEKNTDSAMKILQRDISKRLLE